MKTTHCLPEPGRFLQLMPPTPLVKLALEGGPPVWCKLEFLNPSGSSKDRISRFILEKAWRQGLVRAGSWVVEASSGSTSLALALACAQMGLRFLAVLPMGVSDERVMSIRAYGGEIVRVPREEGMNGAIALAESEAARRGGFATRQFENPDNPEAHRLWTAQEILRQLPGGHVDAVVSGVGTGGTIVGLCQGLSQTGCHVTPYAAIPQCGLGHDLECCSFSTRIPGVVQGISKIYTHANLPGLKELLVADDEALEMTRRLIRHGFPVGPSSGLNLVAARRVAKKLGSAAHVVTVFADRMERYFSTELFQPLTTRSLEVHGNRAPEQ